MGMHMELDLTAGLAQLKTTDIMADSPEQETAPESAPPSFSTLLDTDSQLQIDSQVQNPSQTTPPVMPPRTPSPTPAISIDEPPKDIRAVDITAAAPGSKLASPAVTTSLPTQPPPETAAAPLPAEQTRPRAQPDQPIVASTATTPGTSSPISDANPPAPTPAPSPTSASSPAPAILAAAPAKKVSEPRAEILGKAAEAMPPPQPERAAPKGPKAPTPAPASSISTPLLEPAQDQTTELTFGLKIERHALESAHSLRPAPQHPPAPVASQIASQLPQVLSKAEKQTVELRLDPPELGRVTIHITTHDQQVTAHVVAERVDTVDLMRRHAELLTATLARAGFSQSDLTFQQGKGGNAQGGFEQFQGFSGMAEADTASQPPPTLAGQDGRLDIRL